MRIANVFVNEIKAGILIEHHFTSYVFKYDDDYNGPPVSLTLPLSKRDFNFNSFPAFFEGLLPEGLQLEAILRDKKINRNDYFSQLLVCGADCVGAVSIKGLL